MRVWLPTSLAVLVIVLAAALGFREGTAKSRAEAWRAERATLTARADSQVQQASIMAQQASQRADSLSLVVGQLGVAVAKASRRTDSVRVVTVDRLTPDASVADSLHAYQALSTAQGEEIRDLRQAFAAQEQAFAALQVSHRAVLAQVDTLSRLAQQAVAVLARAPLGFRCRIPIIGLTCRDAVVAGVTVYALARR